VSLYRDEGIVLRTQKLGEADRIITILTRRTGRIRAAAKGVRKTTSRFGARLEPFTHVDVQLYERRSLDLITQAETLRPYGEPLAADYPRYTAGTAMLETAEKLTAEEKEPALRQFLLLVGGLRTLVDASHDPRLVLDAFLLRSLSVAGWAPALDECARCGGRGALRAFAIPAGGAVCANCRQAGAATPTPQTFGLMVALLRGDWAMADASAQRQRVECSGLVAAYLQWHLEHGIRSLKHVERAAPGEPSRWPGNEAGGAAREQPGATMSGGRAAPGEPSRRPGNEVVGEAREQPGATMSGERAAPAATTGHEGAAPGVAATPDNEREGSGKTV
jgi:DNA repair protein RecO (recombination protein O)